MIEQLTIEYLAPPLADDLIAEIYPREVEAFETVQFTYAVKALMDIEGVAGFDAFQIETPTQVLGIDKIQIVDEAGSVLAERDLNADIALDSEGKFCRATRGRQHTCPALFGGCCRRYLCDCGGDGAKLHDKISPHCQTGSEVERDC